VLTQNSLAFSSFFTKKGFISITPYIIAYNNIRITQAFLHIFWLIFSIVPACPACLKALLQPQPVSKRMGRFDGF